MPLVESFFKGTNGLLFAYGITNAGKTYTISGTKTDGGILPRIFNTLFQNINNANNKNATNKSGKMMRESDFDYSSSEFDVSSISSISDIEEDNKNKTMLDSNYHYGVWISYLEIYNERIFDLLEEQTTDNGKREMLKLNEDKAGHVFVKGLKEVNITSAQEGQDLITKCSKNRQVANTMLNQDSSRSHSVIVFKLVTYLKDEKSNRKELIKYNKLSIIDLAGSERNNRTKTTGTRLKEASNINTSLMTFGRCLQALRWNQQHPNNP